MGVPFSALLGSEETNPTYLTHRAEARTISSRDGRFRSRPLHQPGRLQRVDFYEITIDARGRSESRPHPPGTVEILAVTAGRLRLTVGEQVYDLAPGDAIEFAADQTHRYENRGRTPCVASHLANIPPADFYNLIVYG